MHPFGGECEKEPAVSKNDSRKQSGEPRWLGPASPTRIALIPPISAARWITSNDRAALESFKSEQQSSLAYDGDDCLAILSTSEWKLSRIIEEWPQINFHTTREIR